MTSEQELYEQLCYYTLAHGDPSFIHQHVVDAFCAQHAHAQTKPIALTFALVGLYLHVEKKFSGRQVQQAHMKLARRKRTWPSFPLPAHRGSMSVANVMAAAEGAERDNAIHQWCASVWEAYQDCEHTLAELLRQHGIT